MAVISMDIKAQRMHKDAILLGAKWTKLQPQHREKHFVVHSQIERAEGPVDRVRLEAVRTKSVYTVLVMELANAQRWRVGWH